MTKNKRAFTLIELLVVVLIVGILAAVAVPQYTKTVERSRLAGVWSTMSSIRKALAVAVMSPYRVASPGVWNPASLDVSITCEMASEFDCAVACPSGRWGDECRYSTEGSNATNPVVKFYGPYTIPGGSAKYIILTLDNNGRSCSGDAATCKYLGIE